MGRMRLWMPRIAPSLSFSSPIVRVVEDVCRVAMLLTFQNANLGLERGYPQSGFPGYIRAQVVG